jgi:hypothetical protein
MKSQSLMKKKIKMGKTRKIKANNKMINKTKIKSRHLKSSQWRPSQTKKETKSTESLMSIKNLRKAVV